MKRVMPIAVAGIAVLVAAGYLAHLAQDAGQRADDVRVVDGASPAPVIVRPAGPPPAVTGLPIGGPAPAAAGRQALYALARSEPREADWARTREIALRDTFAHAAPIGSDTALTVTCAATVCEVSGIASQGAEPDAINRGWDEIRAVAQDDALTRRGLVPSDMQFGSGHSLHAFTIYYRRVPQGRAGT